MLLGTEYLLGETSGQYKDLSERMSAFLTNTLNKWMETHEQEANRKLLPAAGVRLGRLYSHLNPQGILKGSPNALADYSGKLRAQGLISGNEGREMHGYNPVEGLAEDYGNPNISTPEDEPETEESEDSDETEDQPEARYDPLTYNFRKLIEHECTRAVKLTKTKDFLGNLQRFYRSFEQSLSQTCEDLGLTKEHAATHCRESQDEIMAAAGLVSKEQLPETITLLVANWVDRCEKFTQ